jgi:bla regulator protein blaR1
MTDYILQVVTLQFMFLLLFDIFLAKEAFFNINRSYLIGAPLVSFATPLIQISALKSATQNSIPNNFPELLIAPQKVIEATEIYNSFNYSFTLYLSGIIISSLLVLLKFSKLFLLIRNNETIEKENIKLIIIPNTPTAFSFFNYIFIGSAIQGNKRKKIIEHELIHSKQKTLC